MASSRAALAVVAIATVTAGIASAAGGWWLGGIDVANRNGSVVDVIDGDTVVVALASGRNETVRLLGVDTPETVHPDRGVECYGPEASDFARSELLGRHVTLETDTEVRDRYGRLLAYVYLDGVRFNDRLLALGFGRLMVIAPNQRHGRRLLEHQLDAKAAGVGLWSACESP